MNELSDPKLGLYSQVEKLQSKVLERAASVSVDKNLLKKIFSTFDYTSLGLQDGPNHITGFINKLSDVQRENKELGHVAAVCVHPLHTELTSRLIRESCPSVKVAVVESAFPNAQDFLESRLCSADIALRSANEIDMVINAGYVLEGHWDKVLEEVKGFRKVCDKYGSLLKVILNTTTLTRDPKDVSQRLLNVHRASEVALEGGAHMLKTSTGKDGNAASIDDFIVMLLVLKAYAEKEPVRYKDCGIKAAGGLKEIQDTVPYLTAAEIIFSDRLISPSWFRLGTSALLDRVLLAYSQ